MGALLGFAGLIGIVVGLIGLIRPIRRFKMQNRKHAGLVIGASFVLLLVGGALTPTEGETDEVLTISTVSEVTTTAAIPLETTTTEAASTTTTPTTPSSSSSTTSPTSTISSTSTTLALPPGTTLAFVVSITDGDTIDVRLDDGSLDTVRLIGINSPERGECYANEATDALMPLLNTEITMTTDISNRDIYDRLLRYLWLDDGTFINEQLVLGGFAIARDYPPDSQYANRLAAAQAQAQSNNAGLWAPDACGPPATGNLRIGHIEYDAPGNDHQNLNGEWVDIKNHGDDAQEMQGWVLKDETASHRYRFPSTFTLEPGTTVSVFTGCGTDTATELYWCSGNAIWNNDGDTAFLLDSNGNIADQKSY